MKNRVAEVFGGGFDGLLAKLPAVIRYGNGRHQSVGRGVRIWTPRWPMTVCFVAWVFLSGAPGACSASGERPGLGQFRPARRLMAEAPDSWPTVAPGGSNPLVFSVNQAKNS